MKLYGNTQRQAVVAMYQPPRRVQMGTTPHWQTLNSSQNTLNTLNTQNTHPTEGHNTGENTPVDLSWGHSSQLLRHKILRQLSANPLSSLGNPGAEHLGNPGVRQVGSNPREARQSPQILCNPSLPHRIPAGRAKSLNITTMLLSRIQFLCFNKILWELSPGFLKMARKIYIIIISIYIIIMSWSWSHSNIFWSSLIWSILEVISIIQGLSRPTFFIQVFFGHPFLYSRFIPAILKNRRQSIKEVGSL